jgi:hypothetical protein
MKRIAGPLVLAAVLALAAAAPAAPASITDGAPSFEIVLRIPIGGGHALDGERIAVLADPIRLTHRAAHLAKVIVRATIVVLECLSGTDPRAVGPR